MTFDGTYQVTVKTPLGAQKGKLTIHAVGDVFSGRMETPSGATDFSDGLINGDRLHWQAETKTPLGNFDVSYTATIVDGKLSGEASTPMGKASMEGIKV